MIIQKFTTSQSVNLETRHTITTNIIMLDLLIDPLSPFRSRTRST